MLIQRLLLLKMKLHSLLMVLAGLSLAQVRNTFISHSSSKQCCMIALVTIHVQVLSMCTRWQQVELWSATMRTGLSTDQEFRL